MRKLTTEEFITKGKLIHGNKYDYSLVNYINNHTKIKIICSTHGEFEQIPSNHLNGCDCNKCGDISMGKYKSSNIIDFISKAKLIHGNKYDYSNTYYINVRTKVKIICNIHGEFEQTPSNHLSGHNCDKCRNEVLSKQKNKTTEYFINKAKLIHGDKFNYSLVNYLNAKNKISIICNKHGEFEQLPYNHLSGSGCPICSESKGEKQIREFLIENNVKFIRGKRYPDCKNKIKLSFDFYLPELNICIEFNGIQHYEFRPHFHHDKNDFILQQQNDNIKTKYCQNNNIKLISIKYTEDVNKKITECLIQ